MCMWEEQGVTKEPLSTAHDTKGRHSCMCKEKSETGSFLEASERNVFDRVFALGVVGVSSLRCCTQNQNHLVEKCGEDNMEKH